MKNIERDLECIFLEVTKGNIVQIKKKMKAYIIHSIC